jgi:hypothetical protein
LQQDGAYTKSRDRIAAKGLLTDLSRKPLHLTPVVIEGALAFNASQLPANCRR